MIVQCCHFRDESGGVGVWCSVPWDLAGMIHPVSSSPRPTARLLV